MITRHITYEGKVQGVGFRASVLALARGYEVAGIIKNLSDGRVELLVRGDTKEVDEFTSAIRESHLAGHIESEQVTAVDTPPIPPLRGFRMA